MGAAQAERGLAIIAGHDALPRIIAEHRQATGEPYLVISFGDVAEAWMDAHPHQVHEFEKAGRLFSALEHAECSHVVFAGTMKRPQLSIWRADTKAASLMGKAMALLNGTDDELLLGLAAIFEDEGYAVIGAQHSVPGLVAAPGVLGRHRPDEKDRADAKQSAAVLKALAPPEARQAAAVAGGVCLGVEDTEGTDALLAQVAEERGGGRRSGVLLKMTRPGQDRRFDLPTIGPRTVEGAARAGLRGIVIEAGGANLLEREATVRKADAAGLFLWSALPGELVG